MAGWLSAYDWLAHKTMDWYRSPSQNEFDYNAKQFVRNIPLIGGFFQADDNSRRMNDYLKNRGLSWSDIRYNQAPYGVTYGSSAADLAPNVSAMSLYRSVGKSAVSSKKGWKGPQYSYRNRDVSYNSRSRMYHRPQYQIRRSKFQF